MPLIRLSVSSSVKVCAEEVGARADMNTKVPSVALILALAQPTPCFLTHPRTYTTQRTRSLALKVARWFLGDVLQLPLFQTDNKLSKDEVDMVVLTR